MFRRVTCITQSLVLLTFALSAACASPASEQAEAVAAGFVPAIKKVLVVVLENESTQRALQQPYLAQLAREGALLASMSAATRPSQPNYFAMTAGGFFGVRTNLPVELDVQHIGNLVEARGKSWKVYAESWPGNCFKGAEAGRYVRKHNPFISFKNVQTDPERCNRIVNEQEFTRDVESNALPDFSFYIPNQENNGHDTGVSYASRWLETRFDHLLRDPKFTDGLLFVVTYDEGGTSNQSIYTILHGDTVRAGAVSMIGYNHFNLLRTFETGLDLGTLNQLDSRHVAITDVWK